MAYVVCAKWTARQDSTETVAAVLRALAPASRAEPGNLEYRAHRDPEDERVYFLYESYRDRDAYQEHLDSAHFERALAEAAPLLESRERTYYEAWEV